MLQYVGRMVSAVKGLYGDLNGATLTGATDVLVVRQPDGSLVASPFRVRFGKLGVLLPRANEIDIEVNGNSVNLSMQLDESGQGYFPKEENIQKSGETSFNPRLSEALLDAPAVSMRRRRCVSESCVHRSTSADRKRQLTSPTADPITESSSSDDDEGVDGCKAIDVPVLQADSTDRHCSPGCVLSDDSAESGINSPPTGIMTPPHNAQVKDMITLKGSATEPLLPCFCEVMDDFEQSPLGDVESRPSSCEYEPSVRSTDSPLLLEDYADVEMSAECQVPNVELSLCGDDDVTEETFQAHRVTYETFVSNVALLSDTRLVVKMNQRYYDWKAAAPILLSLLAFRKVPPKVARRTLRQRRSKRSASTASRRSVISWLRWRRRGSVLTDLDINFDEYSSDSDTEGNFCSPAANPPLPGVDSGSSTTGNRLSESGEEVEFNGNKPTEQPSNQFQEPEKKFSLTSDQLLRLGLRDGANCVTYSVTTSLQGTKRCRANIYLWDYSDKIVVSDIDGTITRSDVLGQLLPLVGKDWSQGGVVELYQQIVRNGYKVLYLSARAIGQAGYTKGYLNWVEQQHLKLPQGPLLLTPESLFVAFKQEVIRKKPEVFKTSLLEEIRQLFPSSARPLFAGFGNRVNDETAYSAVSIPRSRIFYVNPRGQLSVASHSQFNATYTRLQSLIDNYFPPLTRDNSYVRSLADPLFYSSFSYWREPIVDISAELTAMGLNA